MSTGDVLLWIILPYFAIATSLVGHWWRYTHDQFRWTSRSTQLLDRRVLGWASPMFHYGALAAIGGHVIGLVIPESVTQAIGIPESTYRWIAGGPGGLAGAVCIIGFAGLVYRRITSERVRLTTTDMDLITYGLLAALIGLGVFMTFDHNVTAGAHAYNYRPTIAVWFRSIFYLDPNVHAAVVAPLVYQLHAVIGWVFWAFYPFGRLVHAWSIPLQYIGRPYILYRRRYHSGRRPYEPLA